MGPNIAGWFLLAGFLAPCAVASKMPSPIKDPKELVDKKAIQKKINSIRLYKKWVLASIALPFPAIFLGIFLLGSGYNVNFSDADPGAMGRMASRGRGRGGIILLIIQFFPYFLIGGYGYLAWMMFDYYKIQNDRIQSLQTVYSYLSEQPVDKIEGLQHGLSHSISKHDVGNPEHFASQVIKKINERDRLEMAPAETPKPPSTSARKYQNKSIESQIDSARNVEQPENTLSQEESIKGRPEETQSDDVDALEKELLQAKSLKERGLISEEEYKAMRAKILGL